MRCLVERIRGIEPRASTVAWSRSPTELHPLELASTAALAWPSCSRHLLQRTLRPTIVDRGDPSVTGQCTPRRSCGKQEGPDPCWNPGLDKCSSWRVMRLCAPLARWLQPILITKTGRSLQGQGGWPPLVHRHDEAAHGHAAARERQRVVMDAAEGVHDESQRLVGFGVRLRTAAATGIGL